LNKVSEGMMLPVVDLEDASDNIVSTDTWLGEPLLVNFWFTTCEPCRREFPVLVQAADEYPGLRFIGVNLNDTSGRAMAFAAEFGATFEMYFDRDGRLTSAMGVATAPVTLLIDAGGVVRRQITGEVTAPMLRKAIDEVFPS
jgi:thiol-disulfide isomerase/thioredoxin